MSGPDRIRQAAEYSLRLHDGQTRKGSGGPYVLHPFTVAGHVADSGGDENQIIAALLHDAVEDAGGAETRAEIAARFGDDVARLVDGCTDTDVTPKPPWRPRKEAFLKRLRGESERVRLIVAADKLHNVRAVSRDLRQEGPKIWRLFSGGCDGSLWYYRETVTALRAGWDHPLVEELDRAVTELEGLAGG